MQPNPRLISAGVVAFLAVALALITRARRGCDFTEVAPGVYRCTQPYFAGSQLAPVLIRVDESKGLLFKKHTNRWILVDASYPDSAVWGTYSSKLVRAVRRRLAAPKASRKPDDKLDLIICESRGCGEQAGYHLCIVNQA
jgi:hypothetical protein